MLDGDGCIYMGFAKVTNKKGKPYKSKERNKIYYRLKDRTYFRPSLQVSVTNSYYPLIEWIWREFGGSVYTVKKRQKRHKNKWTWRSLKSEEQWVFLSGILPHLKEKSGQAKLALAWLSLKGKHHAERRCLAEECKKLNNRESVTTNTPDIRRIA